MFFAESERLVYLRSGRVVDADLQKMGDCASRLVIMLHLLVESRKQELAKRCVYCIIKAMVGGACF